MPRSPITTAAIMTVLDRLARAAGVPLATRGRDGQWSAGLAYDDFDPHRGTFRLTFRTAHRCYAPLDPVRTTVGQIETTATLIAFFAGVQDV